MAPKICHILILVMAIALSTPSTSFAESPVVNFMDQMDANVQPATVSINCKQGGFSRAKFDLVPGQKQSFKATLNGVYNCAAFWGRLFGSVEGFNPARDKGHKTVNWKVDKEGLSLSYDQRSWELVEPWESD